MIEINSVPDLKKAIHNDSRWLDHYLEITANSSKNQLKELLDSFELHSFFLFLINLDDFYSKHNHVLLAKTINHFNKFPKEIDHLLRNQIYYAIKKSRHSKHFESALKNISNIDINDYAPKIKVPEIKEKPKKQLKSKKQFNIGILF